MKTHLRSLKNIFWKCFIHPTISGRSRPRITSAKIAKIAKKSKKSIFSKIDILWYTVREYDFWPGTGPLDPPKYPETLYWPSYAIWLKFFKSWKNPISDPKNHDEKFSNVDFSGRWIPSTKLILGIYTPYWCPQTHMTPFLKLTLKSEKKKLTLDSRKRLFF